ncbi:MAG: indolepyruvate ferredoxin oxidoreductase family protein, partial [bacterium]|nr:indolepyruvate ferredoxin oxidoreductase family protein [bacterium]
VHSEGAKRVAIVSNEPASHKASAFPPGTEIFHRDELDRVQKEMRELAGTTVIVFDQPCAAELRRRRKRGTAEDPDLRVVINERVCEGCGDCGIQSNCIAIEPMETSLGRKRRINQSACNKDVSCLGGLCPSFVTVRGGTPRKANQGTQEMAPSDDRLHTLPPILPPTTREDYSMLVAGIGGTGVVTIGALVGMAAHLEGRSATILDNTGASQKNGSVMSHIQIGADSVQRRAPRLPRLGADLLIGCDIVVSSTVDALDTIAPGITNAVVNEHVAPTAAFATQPSLDFSSRRMRDDIESRIGDSESAFVNATQIATKLMGDAIATNLFLTGYALQRGWIPLGSASIDRAIELNGVAVAMNRQALAWGRLFALDPDAVFSQIRRDAEILDIDAAEESADAITQHRSSILTQYQSAKYARRYEDLVARVRLAEQKHIEVGSAFEKAVARSYFKLLAYKDEYEVARLYSDGQFARDLAAQFEGSVRVSLELAPPLFARRDKLSGRLKKRSFGPWIFPVLRGLARLKFLRGTPVDIFGYTAHRRMERRLIGEYEATVEELIGILTPANHSRVVEIAALPSQILGFDQVKENALAEVEERKSKLLEELRSATS